MLSEFRKGYLQSNLEYKAHKKCNARYVKLKKFNGLSFFEFFIQFSTQFCNCDDLNIQKTNVQRCSI
jgi:hypothetical protein